jgi:ArsR family transcriptional regulator
MTELTASGCPGLSDGGPMTDNARGGRDPCNDRKGVALPNKDSAMSGKLRSFKADFFKALAHPVRIFLIDSLRNGERSVGELSDVVGLELANVSQQLAVLRAKNIVASRKEGNVVYYSVVDPELFTLLDAAMTIFNNHLITVQDVLQHMQSS